MIPDKFERRVDVTIPWSSKLSKNRAYKTRKGGGMYIDRSVRTQRAMAAFYVKKALGNQVFEKGPIWLILRVEKPDMRSDAINLIDGVADVVKAVIGVDDRWFHVVCTWSVKKPAQIHIIIGQ